MIPRPGPSGHLVLGGTYIKDDYSTLPDLDTAKRILQDCYKLEPLLAGKNGMGWEDIEVVAHNVGLRPAREGGARVELETRRVGGSKGVGVGGKSVRGGREVAVVHAYGFGGTG
jgi:hypothetical protein